MITPRTAQAQSLNCTGNISDIAFGTVSLRTGVSNETSGTITINCTGVGTIGICIYIAAGSGGAGAGFSPRFMRRADSAALNYQLRPNGNGTSGGIWDSVFVEVATAFGAGSISVPVFADITSVGTSVGAGSYSSTFTGTPDVRMEFNTNSCAQPGTARQLGNFTVSASVAESCEVDAGNLDFGTLATAGVTVETIASTTFLMRCTQGTTYTVSLDNGTGAGATGPTDRRLTGPSAQLSYGLYLDAARSQPWSTTPGSRGTSTGTGFDQGMTVYGQIHAGQPLIAGAYSDSVLITVEY